MTPIDKRGSKQVGGYMKLHKTEKTIMVKLQGRENKENVTRTITLMETTELEVTEHIKNLFKTLGCDPFTKPMALHIKIGDDKGFTVYGQQTPTTAKFLIERSIEQKM